MFFTFSECQVKRSEALSNGGHEGTLEADFVFVDRLDDGPRDAHRSVRVFNGGNVDCVPNDGSIGSSENPKSNIKFKDA